MKQTTLAIVKPDAFGSGKTGKILAHLEREGFEILASRVARLREEEARAFYEVHAERPFYASLVAFMTSGPCMPVALRFAAGHPWARPSRFPRQRRRTG